MNHARMYLSFVSRAYVYTLKCKYVVLTRMVLKSYLDWYISKFSPKSFHYLWATARENLTLLHVTNKVADQPAHPRSLISAIAIRLLESMIAKVATCKLSIFLLVAEQTGLDITRSETIKKCFLVIQGMH